jgi:KRAB domain-containing zinc finger protein
MKAIHLPSDLMTCELCQAKVKSSSIQAHMTNIHSTASFQCDFCKKSFRSENLLKMHKRIHDKKFQCQICERKFTNKFKIDQHVRDFHENPKSYECEICGLKFDEKRALDCHRKIHNENRPKPFKCPKCEHSTHTKSLYKKHLKSHENLEKKIANMKNKFKCNLCPYVGIRRKNLTGHIMVVHSGIQYECDFCGSVQKVKRNLRLHIESKHLKKSLKNL